MQHLAHVSTLEKKDKTDAGVLGVKFAALTRLMTRLKQEQ